MCVCVCVCLRARVSCMRVTNCVLVSRCLAVFMCVCVCACVCVLTPLGLPHPGGESCAALHRVGRHAARRRRVKHGRLPAVEAPQGRARAPGGAPASAPGGTPAPSRGPLGGRPRGALVVVATVGRVRGDARRAGFAAQWRGRCNEKRGGRNCPGWIRRTLGLGGQVPGIHPLLYMSSRHKVFLFATAKLPKVEINFLEGFSQKYSGLFESW